MKFTHSFLDAVVCCLLALPISLANFLPECSSNGKDGCECTKQMFACDLFSPETCGSIYMSPDKPDNKVNVPWEVAKDAYAISNAIFSAVEKLNPFALFALPFKLVNNGKAGDNNYDIDDAFVDAMKKNVQNYVAQAVSQAEMADLYDGIKGNNAVFKIIAQKFEDLQNNKEKENEEYYQTRLLYSIQGQIDSLVRQYPKYESKTPTIDPLSTPTNSKTGANGWGIYYSAFVNQLLLAFQQDIAVTGIDRLAVSIESQRLLVEYGWKAMKHANMLIDTYIAQRESDITGPTSQQLDIHTSSYYEIKDARVYYHEAEGSAPQTCSWDADNPYEKGLRNPDPDRRLYGPCDQSTVDFVKTHSIHCKEGRRQFVTGSIINNWNTWLIEPAKQWAKLVDLICASGDTNDEVLQRQCTNQGETYTNTSTYKNNGGTASDYINNKEEVVDYYGPSYVLGFEDTNDCPPDSSHVIERDQCQDAYNQLATTMEGIHDGVKYPGKWDANTRPSGCFLYLTSNTVNFNPDINNESGAGGDTLGGDRPICRRTFFVLGPKNTNDCPLGSSHVITRIQCHDAYSQLSTTMEGINDDVDYFSSDPQERDLKKIHAIVQAT